MFGRYVAVIWRAGVVDYGSIAGQDPKPFCDEAEFVASCPLYKTTLYST